MNGVDGVDGVEYGPEEGDAGARTTSRVYRPVGDPRAAPDYHAFRDPAAAHGWQNAYDDTVQLDEVVADGPGPGAGHSATGGTGELGAAYGGAEAGWPHESYESYESHESPEFGERAADGRVGSPDARGAGGRRARPVGGRRATLGRRRARRRGALVAGGVGAALLVGGAAAGLAGLGSGDQEAPGVPAPTVSAPVGDRSGDGEADAPSDGGTSGPAAAGTPSPDTSTTPSATTGPSGSASSAPASVTPSTSPSASPTSSRRGNGNGKQGRGQGVTKGPKQPT
ncbi:hypothetical protein [Streptomyces sp. VNUA24]|uniref:hypothetical protein n=1 Tax=Streptomyces sp. VNUA24 TaxID=3031131 RepID=UPI0023B79887|nr:hypothetical protein [Streptomyces sp. VNUA24]WEH15583.1 hypothetical protein PYR72_18395 [Streptomyces sp. VNUA24]